MNILAAFKKKTETYMQMNHNKHLDDMIWSTGLFFRPQKKAVQQPQAFICFISNRIHTNIN